MNTLAAKLDVHVKDVDRLFVAPPPPSEAPLLSEPQLADVTNISI